MSSLLITTTSGRPKALAALEKWVAAQTTEDYDWLIVCDDAEGYKFPKGAKVVKRDPTEDTLPSICHNWLTALDYLDKNDRYDKMIVLEDDDYYAPSYVRETRTWLDKADLVGWQEDAYYYVHSRKAKRTHNIGHAALAATAFRRSVLPYFRECCLRGEVFIDMLLWRGILETTLVPQPSLAMPDGRHISPPPAPISKVVKEFKGPKQLVDNFTGIAWGSREVPKLDRHGNIEGEKPRHVGMKENWHQGKMGLSGHDAHSGGGPDIWGDQLRKWVGAEVAKYFLSLTHDPPGPRTGKAYMPNVVLPLPMETEAV